MKFLFGTRGRSHWSCLIWMIIIKTRCQSLPIPSLRCQPAQHVTASEIRQRVTVLHLLWKKVTLLPIKASLCFLQGVVQCFLLFLFWDIHEMHLKCDHSYVCCSFWKVNVSFPPFLSVMPKDLLRWPFSDCPSVFLALAIDRLQDLGVAYNTFLLLENLHPNRLWTGSWGRAHKDWAAWPHHCLEVNIKYWI